MGRQSAIALLARYYAAFNARDWEGMLDCLSDDVAHDINRAVGRWVRRPSAPFWRTWSTAMPSTFAASC